MKKNTQRGSAILIAMISSLVVAIVISFIMQQSQETETSTRMPRVKSAMAALESQLLASAYDGTLFTNCVSGDTGFGTAGCKKINPTEIAKYQVRIPGSRCSGTGVFCGIQVQSSNFDMTNRRLTARIIYTGEEVAMKPIEISSVISAEAWLSQGADCPAGTPLLVGFNNDGTPTCRALPNDCPAGWYVSNFDPMSVTGPSAVACAQLNGTPSCPAGSFISNFQWNGGSNFQVACQPVYNPFVPVPAALGDATTYAYEAASMGPQATWATTSTTTTLPPTTTTLVAGCSTGITANGGDAILHWAIVCVAASGMHTGSPRPDWNVLKAGTPANGYRNFSGHLQSAGNNGWSCLAMNNPSSLAGLQISASRSDYFTMGYIYAEFEWQGQPYSGWAGEYTSNADQCELRGTQRWGDCVQGIGGATPPGISIGIMVNMPSTNHGYLGSYTCTPPQLVYECKENSGTWSPVGAPHADINACNASRCPTCGCYPGGCP